MKILIILIKMKGGVGRANREIADALRKKGHEVDILSREDNLNSHSLFMSILPIRRRVKKLVMEKNYDVIYSQDYSCAVPLLFPYPLFRKKHFCCFCGVKKGNHPDHLRLEQFSQKIIHRTTGKIMGRKLVVIGDRLKEMFPKATLIYRGVNTEKFRPLGKKRDSLGWYHSDNESVTKEEVEEISKNLDLKPLIAKNIPEDEMNEFYNKCKVFVNVPLSAGFNLSWLEAMSANVPTIIGNNEGAGRFLPISKMEDGENKTEELVKMAKGTKKEDYRKWIIDNGFTWENKSEDLIKFFNKHR